MKDLTRAEIFELLEESPSLLQISEIRDEIIEYEEYTTEEQNTLYNALYVSYMNYIKKKTANYTKILKQLELEKQDLEQESYLKIKEYFFTYYDKAVKAAKSKKRHFNIRTHFLNCVGWSMFKAIIDMNDLIKQPESWFMNDWKQETEEKDKKCYVVLTFLDELEKTI